MCLELYCAGSGIGDGINESVSQAQAAVVGLGDLADDQTPIFS